VESDEVTSQDSF
jgi:hypothetical protein